MSELEIFYEDIKPLNLQNKTVKEQVNNLIVNELKSFGDISIIFCSDKYLLDINVKYLNHNYYTDIVTFNYVEGNIISGDLFISVERVKENALDYKIDWIQELYRVVFHGILHLVGYNDKSDAEKAQMRKKEDYYLKTVDFSKIKE